MLACAAMGAADREELRTILRERSVRTGRFTLASGRTSDFYVDVKQTALHPRGARLLGEALLERVRRTAPEAVAVAGVALGGVPLCTAVAMASDSDPEGPALPALVVRKQTKEYGTSAAIEGANNVADRADVVLIEDTVTSGGSSIRALERLREEGYNPLALIAVVDRQEGGAEAIERSGAPFHALFAREDLVG